MAQTMQNNQNGIHVCVSGLRPNPNSFQIPSEVNIKEGRIINKVATPAKYKIPLKMRSLITLQRLSKFTNAMNRTLK